MPKAICEAMNQSQSMRASSKGLTSLSVAQTSAVHISGLIKLPQKAARLDGSIGSNTANSSPTSREVNPWMINAIMKAAPLNAFNGATSACASDGMAAPASRLMGYQMLPWAMRPYAHATIAMATPPTMPPFKPDEYG